MRLTMKQRQAVTAVTVQRYRNGSKKVKRQILDEFCETTGYSRGYARFVLRNHGRQVLLGGKKVIVGDLRKRQQRVKSRYYDEQVVQALSKLWQLLNYVCGKRLVAIMPELIAKLEQFGELRLTPLSKQKLLRISAPPSIACCNPNGASSSCASVLTRSPGPYSNTRFRFAPLPSGMKPSLALPRLIWWPMTAVWLSVTSAKLLI